MVQIALEPITVEYWRLIFYGDCGSNGDELVDFYWSHPKKDWTTSDWDSPTQHGNILP